MQSHICDLAHTLQQGSNSSNTVYCIILFLLLSASSEHLSMFPKHKNITIVTAAVSPVWYKAEQQYSICLSKAHKRKVEFAVFLNCKSFFQILCKVDSSRLRSGSGYKTQTTACYCPRPRALSSVPTELDSFARWFCSGHRDPLFSSRREQAAVEHGCLHDGVCMAVCCLLVCDALAGMGAI